jgi:sepiapterin reductase
MANSINFNDKLCYFLITGASRGIGRRIAIETARKFKAGSTVVLLARSLKDLEDNKAEILKFNPGVEVHCKSLDLTKPSAGEFNSIIQETYKNGVNYDLAVIVHNVGSIGDASKRARDQECYKELEDYYSLNVFAPSILNSQFLKTVKPDIKKLIVNITSKAGIAPMPGLSFYCAGKAARELHFRVVAEEEKNNNVVVLNYAPGPVETEMTVYIQEATCDDMIRGYFTGLRESKTILTAEQTTKRFLQVLEKGKFQTGDHVDFYDEI